MSKVVYSVSPEHVAELVERLEKLARRADKMGVEPLAWTIGEERRVEAPDAGTVEVFQDITVTGTTPRFAGWHFVASAEVYGDELLVLAAPGETVPEGFDRSDTTQSCDHCQTVRDRKQTFLLRHDDGQSARVGSTCLRDFLGHALPNGVGGLLRAYKELDEFADGLSGGAWGADLGAFLTVVAMHCRVDGYVSRMTAMDRGGTSTADETFGWFEAQAKGRRVETPTDQDRETAQKALQWAQAIQPDSDYLHSVAVVARAGFVTIKTLGIAASILRAAELATERAARNAAAANLAETSRHFGTPEERGTWSATLIGCFTTEGHYGTTWIYKFATSEGNAATWFSSRNAQLTVGTVYWVTGTVKQHSEYRGTKETHLTRCKVTTEPPKAKRPRKRKPAPEPRVEAEPGEYLTIEHEREGEYWVWGEGTYEPSSVLAGQTRRRRLDVFRTAAEAKRTYPRATICEHANSAWLNREAGRSFARAPQPGWFDAADAGETW